MAHSVEGRFPFLDHRVVEFTTRVPPHLKMKALREKYLLKKAVGDRIPSSVRDRSKQPYRAPDAASFFPPGGETQQAYLRETLSPGRIRQDGVFDAGSVEKLLQKARLGRAIGVKDNQAVVGILSTQLLMHHFMRGANHADNHSREYGQGTASVRR
jgi:asparagine synthase (glutamine-hydrolysing)